MIERFASYPMRSAGPAHSHDRGVTQSGPFALRQEFFARTTAIRNGDIDGNQATEREATWQPIADTPMHPEYPCAHCIVSGSVAGVVGAVLGADDIPEIAVTSPTALGVTHRWTNLTMFTQEVADARIWAGFHYRFSTRVGRDMGLKIGEYVVRNVMQPVVAGSR